MLRTLHGGSVFRAPRGHGAWPQATQRGRALLGLGLKEVLLSPSGLLPATLQSHETDRPSFLPGTELSQNQLPRALKPPGAGHSPLPDPAQRGYWLVLAATAAQESRGRDCLHFPVLRSRGFTCSGLCYPRC